MRQGNRSRPGFLTSLMGVGGRVSGVVPPHVETRRRKTLPGLVPPFNAGLLHSCSPIKSLNSLTRPQSLWTVTCRTPPSPVAQVVFTPKDLVDRQVVEAYLAANADDKAGRLSGPF